MWDRPDFEQTEFINYHEVEAGGGGPRIGEIGCGELEVAEVAGEHDGDKRDEKVDGIGEDHREGQRYLLLGLREEAILPRLSVFNQRMLQLHGLCAASTIHTLRYQ